MAEKIGPITRRRFLELSTSTLATTCLLSGIPGAGLFPARARASTGKIKIGVIAPSHCALPELHAFHTGLYKANGIDAEIVYMPQTSDIAKALIKKEIAVGQLISPVFFAVHGGFGPFEGKATPLMTAQVGGTNGGVFVVGKNSGIKDPESLRGKTIGVHSPLMVHSLILNAFFEEYNLDPKKDLKVEVIKMSELIPSLVKGSIDGFINPEPLATLAASKGVATPIRFTRKLWVNHPCCLVAMRKDVYDRDADAAEAVFRSSIRSGLVLSDHDQRPEAIALVHRDSAPYNGLSLKGMKKAFAPGRSDFDPFPFKSSFQAVLMMMKERGLCPADRNIDDLITESINVDLTRKIYASLKAAAPESDMRTEKVAGKILVP